MRAEVKDDGLDVEEARARTRSWRPGLNCNGPTAERFLYVRLALAFVNEANAHIARTNLV